MERRCHHRVAILLVNRRKEPLLWGKKRGGLGQARGKSRAAPSHLLEVGHLEELEDESGDCGADICIQFAHVWPRELQTC